MNNYEILGRLVVSGIVTLLLLCIEFGMLADIWKIGPFKK